MQSWFTITSFGNRNTKQEYYRKYSAFMVVVSVYTVLFCTVFSAIPLANRKQLKPFMKKMHAEYLKVCTAEWQLNVHIWHEFLAHDLDQKYVLYVPYNIVI